MLKAVARNIIMAQKAYTLATRADVEAKLAELEIPY
jgi:hypothetical protein